MNTKLTKYISNQKAAEMISDGLEVSGIYYLDSNRRQYHNGVIPYEKINGRVFYNPDDVESYIIKYACERRDPQTPILKKVEVKDGSWRVSGVVSDQNIPLVGIGGILNFGYFTVCEIDRLIRELNKSVEDANLLAEKV